MTLDDQYLSLLDSLARFYNSQITAHVGYSATVTVGILAVVLTLSSGVIQLRHQLSNLLRNWIPCLTSFWIVVFLVTVDLVFLGLYFLAPLRPVSLKYLVGRTQYYIALSQLVFEHMGLESKFRDRKNDPLLKVLRTRAQNAPDGIGGAVIRLFEARLFVSRCHRKNKQFEGGDPKNLRVFGVSDSEIGLIAEYKDYYTSKILPSLGFSMCDLVFLGYKAKINELTDPKNNALTQERGRLLKLEFEKKYMKQCSKCDAWSPLACEACGSCGGKEFREHKAPRGKGNAEK
jgi:ribosomal protein L40E